MKKYLKVYFGEFISDTRDVRELTSAKEVGFDIHVLSGDLLSKDEDKLETYKNQFGFNIHKLEVKKIKYFKALNIINRIRYYIKWTKQARKFNADVISGHDIYATLIAYLSILFIKKSEKPIFIYDSQEFEIGRNTKRGILMKFVILHLERFLARRSDLVIMASDIAADEVKRIHKLKEKPLVVRSIPDFWHLDEIILKDRRKEMLEKLNAKEDTFICIYHGAIMTNRGIEQLIEAISKIEDVVLVVMGYAIYQDYLDEILKKVKENNLEDRFLLLPPTTPDKIWEYTGAADVGAMPIQPATRSYEICLPNKVFETIQSETPLLSTAIIEIETLIKKYDIGLTCSTTGSEDLRKKICIMRDDKEKYKEYKENLKIAKKELCWEKEKEIFIKEFKKIYEFIDDKKYLNN